MKESHPSVAKVDQLLDELLQDYSGPEVSATFISQVTDAVAEEVRQWQARPLEKVYPIVWLDALYVKVRSEGRVRSLESLNRSLRKVLKTKGHFPSDESVFKLLYLALTNIAKRWTMPIPNWKQALSRFAIEFPDRLSH